VCSAEKERPPLLVWSYLHVPFAWFPSVFNAFSTGKNCVDDDDMPCVSASGARAGGQMNERVDAVSPRGAARIAFTVRK
jgi:hypothetical protein